MLAVVAPLTAGGGNELFPPDQLVAYPITARTHFLGGLVLAPVNLVWVLQIFALVAETAYLTAGGNALLGGADHASRSWPRSPRSARPWPGPSSACGRPAPVAGWSAPPGPRRSLGALLVVRSDNVGALLDHAPTGAVVDGVVAGAQDDLAPLARDHGGAASCSRQPACCVGVAGLQLGAAPAR